MCVMRCTAARRGNMALSLSLARQHERRLKVCVAPVKTSDASIRRRNAVSGVKVT